MVSSQDSDGNAPDGTGKGFNLRRAFLKGARFEAENLPSVLRGDIQPELGFRIASSYQWLTQDRVNILLKLMLTATAADRTILEIEVQQCGTFEVWGHSAEEAELLFRTKGLDYLYPYARELVSTFTGRAGLQNVILEPLVFSAIHAAGQLSGGVIQVEDAAGRSQ